MRRVIPTVADIDYLEASKDPRVRIKPAIAEAAREIQWTRVPLTEASIEEQVSKRTFDINPQLSWKEVWDFAIDEAETTLREANSEQALGQLMRAGSQTLANGWYLSWPASWPQYLATGQSDKRAEFYPPLHGSQFPSRTGRGVAYRNTRVLGLDRELINFKWMGGEEFENELFEDDQTGQISQRLQRLGEAMRQLEEAYVAGRLNGAAFTVGDDAYPASNYTDRNHLGTAISGPFSVNMYTTGEGNRLATFHQLDYPNFAELYENAMKARDLSGVKKMIVPDILVVSPFDTLHADTILQSEYFAAIPGLAGQTASNATAGALRGAFSKNVVKNYVQEKSVNIYLRRGEWYLGVKNKGLLFQRRTPMQLVQELPLAGRSFEEDKTRYRSRQRFEVDWIDSRFWLQGNDGSAALSH